MARDDAYRIVQAAARRAWDTQTPLRELLEAEPAAAEIDLDEVFDPAHFVRHADALVDRLDAIA
jgi:adenylosuccinate lyase